MSPWLTIILMGLVTYAIRASVIVLLGDAVMPEIIRRALRYVPPAVLSAIIFPELLMPGGHLTFNPAHNPRLVAGVIAALIAWRARSTLLAIAAGMLVLWGLLWVIG
jgi:branched-subunit amino acid transport protein